MAVKGFELFTICPYKSQSLRFRAEALWCYVVIYLVPVAGDDGVVGVEDHLVVAGEFDIHHGRVALDSVITELLCAGVGRVAEIDAEFPFFLIVVDLAGAETGPLRYLKLGSYEIVFRMLDLAGLGHFDGGDTPEAVDLAVGFGAAAAGGSQYRDYDECEQGYLLHNFCFVYSIAVGH